MPKRYIVLNESNDHGLIAYESTQKKANRLLKIENEVFYIFKIGSLGIGVDDIIRLKYPLSDHYSCLTINDLTDIDQINQLLELNKLIQLNQLDEKNKLYCDYIEITKTKDCEDDCLIVTVIH